MTAPPPTSSLSAEASPDPMPVSPVQSARDWRGTSLGQASLGRPGTGQQLAGVPQARVHSCLSPGAPTPLRLDSSGGRRLPTQGLICLREAAPSSRPRLVTQGPEQVRSPPLSHTSTPGRHCYHPTLQMGTPRPSHGEGGAPRIQSPLWRPTSFPIRSKLQVWPSGLCAVSPTSPMLPARSQPHVLQGPDGPEHCHLPGLLLCVAKP